ncbi:tetratricopeptide repeat protein [Chitinivibrio alkaliphilus]|uniref:Uncharacterized protein n=1 Tax=Chitinivibrio alkaliphilus ACht1 TaxID=1313304 RepID=U7D6G4_9BACT|nr:hypothetical protein [Chitinivibrio alkaliphilus]ERP32109.1 hypothetical protein CALK_0830 [Chitinivibrio alkaliphilus ACht1]
MSCILRFVPIQSSIVLLLVLGITQAYTISEEEVRNAAIINDLLVNCEFERARSRSDSLLIESPESILYYYMGVAVIGLESLDRNEVVDLSRFEEIYTAGLKRVAAAQRRTSDVVMLEGFLQASYFSILLLDGQYVRGVRQGRGALDLIKKTKEMNPQNFDADYFIGFYSFARGELRNRLRFMLFWMPDEIEEGLVALQRCMEHARFMSTAAAMVLADVSVRDGRLEEGRELLDSLLVEYTDSRFLLWTKARYYEALGEYFLAADVYGDLAHRYVSVSFYTNALNTAEHAMDLYEKSSYPAESALYELARTITEGVPRRGLSRGDTRLLDALEKYL